MHPITSHFFHLSNLVSRVKQVKSLMASFVMPSLFQTPVPRKVQLSAAAHVDSIPKAMEGLTHFGIATFE